MKKTLFTLASIALLASCQQGEILVDTTETPEAPRRIGFETFVNKSTRAKGTNSTSLQDFYPTFNVYGWKTVGAETTCVFNNVPVEYFAADEAGKVVYTAGQPSDEWVFENAGWYYENVRYWDQMASKYQFTAYAPAATNGTIDCNAEGLITIGSKDYPVTVDGKNLLASKPSTELAFTGFKLDYMTAQSTVAASPVALEFKHLQAKFNVRIRLDDEVTTAQDVSVKKIEIHNLAEKGYYTNAAGVGVSGWLTSGKSSTYVPAVNTAYSLNNKTQNFHNHYVLEQLIIPQTIDRPASYKGPSITEFDEACIYVEYTIGTELFKSYTSLSYIFATTAPTYTFKAGNQYTINITVGPKPIYFTTSVSEWADEVEGGLGLN